jgi:hypothetical protein
LQVFVAERRFLEDAEAYQDFFRESWHCAALKSNLHLQMLTSSAKLQCSKSLGTMGSTPKWRVNLYVEFCCKSGLHCRGLPPLRTWVIQYVHFYLVQASIYRTHKRRQREKDFSDHVPHVMLFL